MSPERLRRSVLFMPASNVRAIEKAPKLGADVVVLDLEDAVAPSQKSLARIQAVDAVRDRVLGAAEIVVRINPTDTEDGLADLDAIVPAGPDAIVLPKVERPEQIDRMSAAMDDAGAPRGLALWAMIETARAVMNVGAIAELGARRRLGALLVGSNDLIADLRCQPTAGRPELVPFLVQTVAAARAFGLSPIDSVFNAHQDQAGFALEARQARALGFDGKSLIHPDQIAPVHEAYRPGVHEVDWARRVIAAFENEGADRFGAIAIDGRMVERLHLHEARRVVRLAGGGGGEAVASSPGANPNPS